ncbi:hypothetical protein Avbf_17263 [Armadillidium vulgare]|nr:hypothetical protein Avbf_17263 [Armadillidium vulgare]
MKIIKIIKEISTYFSHSHSFHDQNSFLSNLQSGVEVNPNPQFDASLTSEYSDMSADKASSENLLNDIVNESTNSVSTQASNFRQVKKSYIKHSLQCNKCVKLAYSIHELRTHVCWGFPSHDEIANNFDEPIEQSISEICDEKDISKVVIDANEVVSDLCLELEGLHKCSQIAIDKVVKAFSDVCDIDLNYIGNKYNRKNYYKDKGIMCTRKEIKLSDSKAYTLSLPNLIRVILINNSIKECCAKKIDPKCNDGIMRDIIHGNRFLHHPAVKSKLKNNLLLGLYVDDIELVNSLGKNRGIHKICLVHATIFNISVELRSKLSSIFLLGVANANSLKEHENLCLFLEDLIDDFNCLQKWNRCEWRKILYTLVLFARRCLGLASKIRF